MGFFISAFLVAAILVSELYHGRNHHKHADPAPLQPTKRRRHK